MGKLNWLPRTKHAIGFEANNKAEILMHIGLDTVSLEGKDLNFNKRRRIG